MKTLRLNGENNKLYFKNYENRPDEEEFREVISILKSAGCIIGKRTTAADFDVYECRYNDMSFTVYYDISGDYGTSLCAEDENTISQLEMIFNIKIDA